MVSITPYTEVVGQERVARALVGVPGPDGTPPRGEPLGELRAEADAGRYLLPLSGSSGDLIARMAELTGDAGCRAVLDAGHVAVSLGHLDGLDGLDDGTGRPRPLIMRFGSATLRRGAARSARPAGQLGWAASDDWCWASAMTSMVMKRNSGSDHNVSFSASASGTSKTLMLL